MRPSKVKVCRNCFIASSSPEETWSNYMWGWWRGGRGRWESLTASLLNTSKEQSGRWNPQCEHFWRPSQSLANMGTPHWRIWHLFTANYEVSLIHNIDFLLLTAQTLENLFLLNAPKCSWSWMSWFPQKAVCHLICLQRHLSSVIRLPPFTSFWFQTMLLCRLVLKQTSHLTTHKGTAAFPKKSQICEFPWRKKKYNY